MVYVDPLQTYSLSQYRDRQAARVGVRTGHRWCHLVADTSNELHAFAERLGLKRAWYRNGHYNLTPSKRAQAVAAGAVECSPRELVKVLRRVRIFTM